MDVDKFDSLPFCAEVGKEYSFNHVFKDARVEYKPDTGLGLYEEPCPHVLKQISVTDIWFQWELGI